MTTQRLTPREAELLAAYAAGYRQRDLPALWHVSINTVSTQTSNLYRKLGARCRAEAVTEGRRLGLLPAHGSPEARQ